MKIVKASENINGEIYGGGISEIKRRKYQ